MKRKPLFPVIACLLLLPLGIHTPRAVLADQKSQTDVAAQDQAVVAALEQITQVDDSAAAHTRAVASASVVASLPAERIGLVLDSFAGATKRGKNWLRSIASDVADNGDFPTEMVQQYFDDRGNDPDGRYLAFQLLIANGADQQQLLADAASDPSLPVRYLKIKTLLENARIAVKTDDRESAIATYQSIVNDARRPDQLKTAADALAKLDIEVDVAAALGLVRNWQIIGPFDNTDSKHFDTAYPPEQRYLTDGSPIAMSDAAAQKEKGKDGPVEWKSVTSESEMGMVDLNPSLANAKDAVSYAFVNFKVDPQRAGPAEARLGCITANKVWVNGRLVLANNVYHSGTRIDQYVGLCELQPGDNAILIKVLQNAQTEPWAQDWQFQFRFTDPSGAAIPEAE
ncbi:hypothetical protein [Stieleria varia]|uniref:Glycosyl hydrolases family 2, sugar binding domain n=1 Tax=Stieleria varia TaxID=2528005 RepID=A0A5C6AGP6_9BACT|nr:hypothetical protein [Stieleria varia]TWT98478.1 hypothetical protein Pla52n_49920 [Stieleria varia]